MVVQVGRGVEHLAVRSEAAGPAAVGPLPRLLDEIGIARGRQRVAWTPPEQRRVRERIDLPGGDSGPLERDGGGPAVEAQFFEEAAALAIEAGIAPERQCALEHPGTNF